MENIKYIEESESKTVWRWTKRIVGALLLFGVSLAAGCPPYHVWEQGLVGEAELRRAQQNRQIEIARAEAARDAATSLAQAEVERAKGVAQANAIIAGGLGGAEGYLRYLWIHGMQTNNMQVVYIPTEAGIPILEAHRLKLIPQSETK